MLQLRRVFLLHAVCVCRSSRSRCASVFSAADLEQEPCGLRVEHETMACRDRDADGGFVLSGDPGDLWNIKHAYKVVLDRRSRPADRSTGITGLGETGSIGK